MNDDIVKMAKAAGIAKHGLGWTCWEGQLERFAALVAAAEREECAKVCDREAEKLGQSHKALIAGICAASIRERDKK